MIAPARPMRPIRVHRPTPLEQARHLVAEALFPLPREANDPPVESVAGWQAWLLALWMVAVSGTYLAIMLGLFG